MSDKLKPCPFCGKLHHEVSDYKPVYRVECTFCGAKTGNCNSEQEAIKAWNRCVEPTFTPDELDAIRRMFAERYPRSRKLPDIEQSIIDKCNHALARREC